MDIKLTVRGVAVTAPSSLGTPDGRLSASAVALCDAIIARLESLRAYAADHLLALYNETWFTEEIGVLDRAAFMQRLASPSINLTDDPERATVYFEDGGVFAGHYVAISLERGAPASVELLG